MCYLPSTDRGTPSNRQMARAKATNTNPIAYPAITVG